jgi:hypothetical protein
MHFIVLVYRLIRCGYPKFPTVSYRSGFRALNPFPAAQPLSPCRHAPREFLLHISSACGFQRPDCMIDAKSILSDNRSCVAPTRTECCSPMAGLFTPARFAFLLRLRTCRHFRLAAFGACASPLCSPGTANQRRDSDRYASAPASLRPCQTRFATPSCSARGPAPTSVLGRSPQCCSPIVLRSLGSTRFCISSKTHPISPSRTSSVAPAPLRFLLR